MTVRTDRPLLSLSGISRSFGAYKALLPTDLDVAEGEFFSLLGPSGCGKTTTLRIIAGFEAPNTGSVWLAGKDITSVPPNKRDTNTVFQSYALFPHMTAMENVRYPLKMKGSTESDITRRAAQAIERVSMTQFAGRLPHEMSGGQRQRIALARAIVGEPKVLLLDEPLGALDLKLREQMQHVLVQLQRSLGITFVYVTHDQGEALSMSDRIAVMKGGEVQQIGTPDEIYYTPCSRFVADFIGKSNILDLTPECVAGRDVLRAGNIHLPPNAAAKSAAVRFESVRLGDVDGMDVTGDATIVDALFLGSTTELTMDVGGQRLIATVPSRRGVRPARGDAVRFGFDLADVVHLND